VELSFKDYVLLNNFSSAIINNAIARYHKLEQRFGFRAFTIANICDAQSNICAHQLLTSQGLTTGVPVSGVRVATSLEVSVFGTGVATEVALDLSPSSAQAKVPMKMVSPKSLDVVPKVRAAGGHWAPLKMGAGGSGAS